MLMFKCWNLVERIKAEERGEVASWLVLAAGLAAAALVAAATMDGIIQTLAGDVGTKAGAPVAG